MPSFSVIIPTLNEEEHLAQCLRDLQALHPAPEIIVADGGSADRSREIAASAGVKVVLCERGRGRQCYGGALHATGDILLFLHVDTRLPAGAFALLEQEFRENARQIGTFRLAFDVRHWLLDLYAFFSRFETPLTTFGDQCIVVRRTFYDFLGGFPRWSLLEDVRFLQLARSKTRITTFPLEVVSSARRFLRNGIARQQLFNLWIMLQYYVGVSPEELAPRYRKLRGVRDEAAIILFARLPGSGPVKSRLASTVGERQATEFYRSCAGHIFQQARRVQGKIRRYLFCADTPIALHAARRWAGRQFFIMAQEGESLGEKMMNALQTVFEHGASKAILAGTDIPDLNTPIMHEALAALDGNDIVLGPSRDGGYYLVGMKEPHREIFTDMPWGTERVYAETVRRIHARGLALHTLPILMDIDTESDLRMWNSRSAAGENHPVREYVRRLATVTARSSSS